MQLLPRSSIAIKERAVNDNLEDSYEPEFGPDNEVSNGAKAFATLFQYLEEDGWHPQRLTDRDIYRMTFQGKNGLLQCYAQIRVEGEQLLCYAQAPIKVPEEQRSAVAEYLTRANYGMYIGNFELDYNDGEVRFKSSLDFEDEILSHNLIRNTIYPSVRLMDTYLPGLMKVVYGGVDPKMAVEEIEQNQ
jgi:hypothetical protein